MGRKATLSADTNTTGWSLSPYENNQVIVSRQENGRRLVSICAVGNGLMSAPLLELDSRKNLVSTRCRMEHSCVVRETTATAYLCRKCLTKTQSLQTIRNPNVSQVSNASARPRKLTLELMASPVRDPPLPLSPASVEAIGSVLGELA